jgi:hypothetical protein
VHPHARVLARFWAKVAVRGPDECWLWTASGSRNGYGRVWVGGQPDRRLRGAHQFAYALVFGPIPGGLELDHLCRNRRCVNPAHLEAVSHRINTLRGVSPPAENARVTHCPQGHPYDDENTGGAGAGGRNCRACDREGYRRRVGWDPEDVSGRAVCDHCGAPLASFFPESEVHFCRKPECRAARARHYRRIGQPSQTSRRRR